MSRLSAPSMKMKKFVKAYLETGSKKKAALAGYDVSEKNASLLASNVLKIPMVQSLIKTALEERGLTEEKLASGLDILLKRTKPKAHISDPRIYLDTIKEINKLRDNYPAERKQIDKRTASINLDLKNKSEDELMKELSNINDEIKKFSQMVNSLPKIKENV